MLTEEAVAFVDAQVAPFAHKIGYAALERLVQEAIDRFMPELAEEKNQKAADARHVTFHHPQVSFNGTTHFEGELDLGDALDFDDRPGPAGAASLKAAGSDESLDVRRSMAVGEIARHQPALDLQAADETVAGEEVSTSSTDVTGEPRRKPHRKPRQVVLHVHLSEAAIRGEAGLHLARVENTRTGVTADQVRTWCANPDTSVVVNRSSTSTSTSTSTATKSPSVSRSRPKNATTRASSPGAPDQPRNATPSTACPTTRAGPPAPATSPRCAGDITG